MPQVQQRSPIVIVHGHSNMFVNDMRNLEQVLKALELVPTHARQLDTSANAIVETAQRVQNMVSENLQVPCKTLRDAIYLLRKRCFARPNTLKQLQQLNEAYSFVRHSTALVYAQLVEDVHGASFDGACPICSSWSSLCC